MQQPKFPFINPILGRDSYKLSHPSFINPDVTLTSAYGEARKDTKGWGDHILFGAQAYLNSTMLTPFTKGHVEHGAQKAKAHGEPYPYAMLMYIVERYGGYWPVEIQAVPEGLPVPFHTPVYQVADTDERTKGLASFIEMGLLRAIWYPSTVASLSRHVKKRLARALDETEGNRDFLDFMLHDFGGRGVSSAESAMIGGGAHLVNFKGTDTLEALAWLECYYDEPMAGFSVAAAEHSTIQSFGGPEGEVHAFERALDEVLMKPGTIASVVSDTYDLYNAVSNLWGDKLASKVRKLEEIGSKLVIRPDSGDPTKVPLDVITMLMEKFGHTKSAMGFKKLPAYLGVIQGDGMNTDTIDQLHTNAKLAGLSSANIVVGMGGGLLQKVDRDTMGWAQKISARKVKGSDEWQDVFKNPKTDPGKRSKPGRQAVVIGEFGIPTAQLERDTLPGDNILRPVYRNGEVYSNLTLAQVRENAAVK